VVCGILYLYFYGELPRAPRVCFQKNSICLHMTTSILKSTWDDVLSILKKNPWLWILGFFATFLGQIGVVAVWNILGGFTTPHTGIDPLMLLPELWRPVVLPLSLLSLDGVLWLICLAIIGVGSLMMLLSAAAISQGALMHCMYQWRHHDTHPDMHKAWHKGSRHVERVVWLNIIRLGGIYVLAVIIAHGFVLSLFAPSFFHTAVYAILFFLGAALAVALSLGCLFATGYVVMDDRSVFSALRLGFGLLRSHWLPSLEIGFLIAVLQIGGLMLVALIAGLLIVPTAYLWLILLAFIPSPAVAMFFGVVIAALVFGIICASSFVTVCTTLLWSDLFLRMHHVGVPSGIRHLFRHWPFLHTHIGKSV
jgi:hypothetical protein